MRAERDDPAQIHIIKTSFILKSIRTLHQPLTGYEPPCIMEYLPRVSDVDDAHYITPFIASHASHLLCCSLVVSGMRILVVARIKEPTSDSSQ